MAVTISAEDISKLLQQLKSGFERTINWNKYQSKVSIKTQNPYLTFQISNCLDWSKFSGSKQIFCFAVWK